VDQAEFDAIVEKIVQQMAYQDVPGAAVAVVCGGELAFSAGIGVTAAGGSNPITPDTRFQWASVSKMFTAAAGVALAEDGQLDLHAPASTYVPYTNTSAPFGDEFTLHHLLSHTAGFATSWEDQSPYEIPGLFQEHPDEALWAAPGAVFLYSNLGFALAGTILQEATGQPFADVVEDNIFAPAGMTGASLHPMDVVWQGNFAYGHTKNPSYSWQVPIPPNGAYYAMTAYLPMGGVWASVNDMARWGLAHLEQNASVMSPASWTALRAHHTETRKAPAQYYGYGLYVDASAEQEMLHHNGSVSGFASNWVLIPDLGFGIFFVANSDWYYPSYWLTDEAITTFSSGVTQVDLSSWMPDSTDWPDYVGTYQDDVALGTVVIEEQSGALYAKFTDLNSEQELIEGSCRGSFTLADPILDYVTRVSFWKNPAQPDGPAQYLVTLRGVAIREASGE
jgi:CubicO group peptidase (beta-lactamase class C family)